MKKIISLLVLVLAMTVVMSVSAFAAKSFSVAEDAVIPEGVTVTPAADSIAVSVPATDGADYSILLVSGSALPTSDSVIAYINQAQADGTAVSFDVLPLMSVAENATDGELTLYVGTNATGEDLISIPVTYLEDAPAGPNVTLMNGATAVEANLVTDAEGNVTLPATEAFGKTSPAGYTFTLYSWVTADETVEYLADAKVAAADLDGKTLYAKFVCASPYGDVDSTGTITADDYGDVLRVVQGRNARKQTGKLLIEGLNSLVVGDIDNTGTITADDYGDILRVVQGRNARKQTGKPVYYVNK